MNARHAIFSVALGLQLGAAVAAGPQDYVAGIAIEGDPNRPVWQLEVPDAAYAGTTRARLEDVGVFNAQQIAVPHAICSAAETAVAAPPTAHPVNLPVFPVQGGRPMPAASDTTVSVQARRDVGVRVEVSPSTGIPPALTPGPPPPPPSPPVRGYVIDARAVGESLTELRLGWQTADGASEIGVRVEASDTLEQWRVVVPHAVLVRLEAQDASIERTVIALPVAHYAYLRLVRADDGPAPVIDAVIATALRYPPASAVSDRWFDARNQPAPPAAPFDYDAGRRAPVHVARIELAGRNQMATLALLSRPDPTAPWQMRWQGERFRFEQDGEVRTSGDIAMAATTDPLWRVQVLDGREGFGSQAPVLRLGYAPDVLRFVTQGEGPFVLAYGSVRAPPATRRPCEWWRQAVPSRDAATMLGAARAGAVQNLGGDAALQAAPVPVPVRRYVFWAVLVAAALLLVAMSVSLLRRVRQQ
jgi:hypothetical protein